MPRKRPVPTEPADQSPGESEERNLIVAFQRGERSAFDELWERYAGAVYNFTLRMVKSHADAEELAQETWLRVVRSAKNYQPKAKMLTWILQIARNLCLDFFKRQALRQHQSLDAEPGRFGGDGAPVGELLADPGAENPIANLLAGEQHQLLVAAIDRLSEAKREAVVLRFFHELPYDDIALIVNAPAGTVKYRVHEAIRDLGTFLEKTANFRP